MAELGYQVVWRAMLMHSPPIRFLHPVGRSTLQQGITIPAEVQVSWLAEIKKGEKVAVEIRFGHGQSVYAYLRRINNAVGHLQFRYETRKQSELRSYLREVCGDQPANMVLEIIETEPYTFLFRLVSDFSHSPPALSLYKPHFHALDESTVRAINEFHELDECFTSIRYSPEYNQSDYNTQIAQFLVASGWRNEVRILKEIGLRCDFEKNGIWVEVEFGNARSYYQDVSSQNLGENQLPKRIVSKSGTSRIQDIDFVVE